MTDYSTNPHLTPTLVACLQAWGIKSLTDIQKLSIDQGIATGQSAIVCAPTSSGKTLVGELALANALSDGLDALYLVSHKALADQKYSEFSARFSTPAWKSSVSVGISTGDREEGDVNCRVLVSTYEKALGLVLAGRLKISKTIIIADELQILGEAGRGASIETLCALLRQRQPKQFVGLTATVENPEDLAAWMNCKTIRSSTRDVDLFQTIRYEGKLYTVPFGQDLGKTTNDNFGSVDLHGLISQLVRDGRGPVLVFTETRNEAAVLAAQHAEQCQRATSGLEISKQLEFFSEPTESSENLRSHAERLVTYHTADLTSDERAVIEDGFSKGRFQVCFATSTLAAGVNYPFRTVIIPKLTYQYGERAQRLFARSDYRNMSGRAGRLGLHPDGHVLILPQNAAELKHANVLIGPENDRIQSQLVTLSMRRTVLSLITAKAVTSKKEITTFFKNTFYWHLIREHNPKLLETLVTTASKAVDWLLDNGFVEESHGTLLPAPLGKTTSLSGLLPETAKQFVDLLKAHGKALHDSFGKYEVALIHWILTCSEFTGDRAPRFLPFPSGPAKPDSSIFLEKQPLLTAWDRTDHRTTRCVHAISLFIAGEAERKIRYPTGVTSGNLHRLANDLSWIMDGLSCISGASELRCPQGLTNQLSMLARRIRWGTPTEALDMLRIASQKRVPGFGRQRVMALLANGMATVLDVLSAQKDKLAALLGSEDRTNSLLTALSDSFDGASSSYQRLHMQLAGEIGLEAKVAACTERLGTEYDQAIYELLKEEALWAAELLDDGKRKNVPDIQLVMGDIELLIECKTVTKRPPLIGKEEAFAVLQKAADYNQKVRRITLGKPDFDETSKKKAASSAEITLVQHAVFMEGLMRVLTGRLAANEFVKWLAEPGVADLRRLPGTPSFADLSPTGSKVESEPANRQA